jgi:hypothetical protein
MIDYGLSGEFVGQEGEGVESPQPRITLHRRMAMALRILTGIVNITSSGPKCAFHAS